MKFSASALALAVAALCASAPASADIVISFVPSATNIAIGETVSVAMNISGLDAEILSAFDINLLFNEGVLDNFSVAHNVALQWPGSGSFNVGFGSGDTDVFDFAFGNDAALAGQANSFTVLTFGFTGVADGSTFMTLGLDPDFERNFVGLGFATLPVTVGGVCVSVGTGSCDGGTVPEPASYGLAGMALLAAGFASRTRRRQRVVA